MSLILGREGRQAGYLRLCQSDGVDYILLSDVMSCAVPWLGGRSEAVSGSQQAGPDHRLAAGSLDRLS